MPKFHKLFGQRSSLLALIFGASGLGFGAGPTPAAVAPQPFVPEPDTVLAGASFRLHLATLRYDCNTVFAHHQVDVIGDSVVQLSFTAEVGQHPNCAQFDTVVTGLVYAMPALKPGGYALQAWEIPACVYPKDSSASVCKIAPQWENAGRLTVVAANTTQANGWTLSPRSVKVDSIFDLKLLNARYHPCRNSFDHASLQQSDGGLFAVFSVTEKTGVICTDDIRPAGPSFRVNGLPAGRYPVYLTVRPACSFEPPICPIAYQPPELVDTLTVGASSVLGLSLERPMSKASRRSIPSASPTFAPPGKPGAIEPNRDGLGRQHPKDVRTVRD